MNDFVTIATYDDYLTANFDKQKLEDRGIHCYLADENTIAIKWIIKNALGGIKLRVPYEEIEKAKTILAEETEELKADHTIETRVREYICPGCGSNNTGTEKFSKSTVGWSWIILGFPIPLTLNQHHRCFYCGHRWET